MIRNIFKLAIVGFILMILLVAGITLLTPSMPADHEAMSAADQLVETGHYSEAIGIYEQFAAQGVQDSVLFYNLGNAYYKQGDLGRAILNYQRAAQLNPRDEDIEANLAMARSQAVDPFPVESDGPLSSLAEITAYWLTINETAVLTLGFWFFATLLFLGWRLLRDSKLRTAFGYLAITALFMVLLAGTSLGSRLYSDEIRPEGVIVAPVVAVSTEPGEQYATEISLQSGTEIRFAETSGDWVRLDTPEGIDQGWVPAGSIELFSWPSSVQT